MTAPGPLTTQTRVRAAPASGGACFGVDRIDRVAGMPTTRSGADVGSGT